jgi:hypothetical protein
MAYEVIKLDGRTFVVRRHPYLRAFLRGFGNFYYLVFAIGLVLYGVSGERWLIVPTILILGGMVWLKVSAKAKAKSGPPSA